MKRFRNGQGTTFRSGAIVVNSINMNNIMENPNQNTELFDGIGDGNNSNSNFSMNNSNGGGGTAGNGAGALVKRRYELFQMSNSQDSSSFPLPLQSPNDEYSNSVFSTLDNEILGDKIMQPPEEPNYFAEKYSGKVCALCNLGERSQLGQGELLRIELRDNEKIKTPLSSPVEGKDPLFSDKSPRSAHALQLHNRRQKGLNKCKNPVTTAEYVNELDKIGYVESLEFSVLHDGAYFYVHRSCAMWSFDIVRELNGALDNISNVVISSLTRKCSYCQRFGASIACKMSCPKYFHYPCVAASGAFQIIQTYATFCKEHLGQVPLVCSDDINCRTCAGLGDVSNLMTCSVCGDHYHGSCIGVAQQPGIRAGWQCTNCRSCQICRVPDSTEGRTVGCEQCDKIYHATCLRPVMTTIPKFGWKCRCCRVCSDCGSRSPGAGTSSRWHAHYTVCDSCYQQRNKGFQCPICHRAYRAASLREMVKCNTCNKFVHSSCDQDAEPSVYHAKKDSNPEYEYVCIPCKSIAQNGRITAAMRRNSTAEEDNMSVSQESLYDDSTMDVDLTEKILPDVGLGKGKPFAAIKVAKKRLGLSSNQSGRPKGIGKLAFQKRFKFSDFGRKRNTKSKMRGIFGVPGVGLQKPSSQATDNNTKPEEEPGIENRLVLCSAKDKFILTQDICVMCGAIGTDQEGCLISCVQCGQCYHPYCVMVKVTKVILQKGWRCLDCTVCEGCGQRNDEARLILCDDCDISYHIYCMDPPLDYVPHGNWKCKWCAICLKCGTNDPGKNSLWMSSYTECGPCSSQSNCPVCTEGYSEGELIIQCTSCDRWLHCACDAIRNEDDAERCAEDGYTCILCRPRDVLPPHLQPKKIKPAPVVIHEISKPSITQITTKMSTEDTENGLVMGLDGNHYLDGICLSELGLKHIKSLQLEQNKKKRKPKIPLEANAADKEAGILAAIESVVAGSSLDNSLEDVKFEPLNAKEEAEIYKDGMVWDRADASPPEGFTLCQTEQGVVVLRKRRQRNLQKLGIGGFSVRNRNMNKSSTLNKDGIKEECDDTSEQLPTITESQIVTDKKKKPIRKKQKNKLIETYPSYLQEAFFGKSLLDTTKPKFESSSSEDEAKSSVSEDKTIKLSMEELKMIEAMRAKQQQQIQQHAQLTPPISGIDQKVTPIDIKPNNPIKEEMLNEITPPKKEKLDAIVDEDSDTDALKDILPNDLLDTDLVNTIMNENDDIGKNAEDLVRLANDTADMIEGDGRVKNNEFNDLFSSHFNYEPIVINSKDVEEIFKVVLTDESQESQESSVIANNPKKQQHQIIPPPPGIVNQQQIVQQQQHQQPSQQQQHHQQIMVQSNNQNMVLQQQQQRGIVQTGNSNMMQQMGQQNIVQQHLVQQQHHHVGMDMMNQQAQVMQQQQQVPQRPQPPMTPQNKIIPQFVESPYQKQITQSPQWPTSTMMGQGQLISRMDSVESNISSVSTPGTEDENVNTLAVAQPSYNQKTSERMKHDEVLGDMATISAVLYANINHPELKGEYPNWPDRFKQILKKWRALSNEQKAPYLQQSRDNRSQLKMKKSHQVPSPKDVSSKNSSTITIPVTSASPILSDLSSPDGRSQHQIIIGHANPQQHPQVQNQQQLQQHQQQQQQQSQQHLVEVQGNSMDGNLEQLTASSLNFNIINNKSSASDNNINNSTITNTPPTTISTTITSNSTTTTPNLSSFVNSIHNNNTNASFNNNSCNSLDSTTSELNDSDSKSTNTNSNDNNSCSNSNNNNNNDNCNSLTATFVKSNNNANISAAANIANSFINLTNLQTGNLITQNTIPANLNVIVSQPITHHFMKTFTIGKVTTKSNTGGPNNIIVPNVIASNLAPQFTLHHQYGLHTNTNGPAPNVTVNPNGNFQTNPNSVLRPTFRPIFQPNQTVNLNIIGTNNNVAVKSPILAAQLQTITQMASNQLQQQQQQQQINATAGNKTATLHYQLTQQPLNETQNILAVKITSPAVVESSTSGVAQSVATTTTITTTTTSRSQSPFSYSPQPPKTPSTPSTPRSLTPHQSNNNNNNLNNNDQQIRVLTPSEIMRTLPSLPNQDVDCCFENTNNVTTPNSTIIKNNPININLTNNNNNVSNCLQQQQQQLSKTNNNIINSNSNTQVISSSAININPTSQCVFSTTDPSQINTNSTIITTSTSNALSTDQEKITAQQKSLREQEQERQWKQLQVMRAREQQMQQLVLQEQRTQDPTMQLQISTNNNNYSIGPLASPSPNSRSTPFVAPASKGRIGGTAQSPTTFHHPGKQMRPVQIARTGAIQQNMTPNPFSPQSQTPLSPLDQQFPGSPATQTQIDPFSRPSSENSQPDTFIQHSPQSARSFGQQSPNQAQNRSPAYVSQPNSQILNNSSNTIRLNMDSSGYSQPPGTPRPQFSAGANRPTVYARSGELFDNNQSSPFTSPRNDMFQAQQQQQQQQQMQVQSDRNRQLRDLLQRQQNPTPTSPICTNPQQMMNPNSSPTPSPRWNGGTEIEDSQNTISNSPNQTQSDITFRQPLPPSMILRPQRMAITNPGGKIIRANQLMQPIGPNQIGNPRGIAIGTDVRQRIIRPGSVMIPGKQIITQQSPGGGPPQQFIISNTGQRMPINININRTITPEQFNQSIQSNQQQQHLIQQNLQSGSGNNGFINQRGEDIQSVETKEQTIQQATTIIDNSIRSQAQSNQSNISGPGETVESNEIPDNVTAELEKLEQEEGNGIGEVEGVGDILGGLDEDDDDLLVSLTAEMGAHFNILEYADPELDTLNDGEKANLLDSLELDDGESDKDDKKKELEDKHDIANQQKSNTGELNKNIMQMTGGENQLGQHQAVSQAMQQQQQSNSVISTQQVVIGRNQHPGMHPNIIHSSANMSTIQQQQQGSQLIMSSGSQQESNQFQHINRIKTIQMISTQQQMQPGMQQSQQQQLQQHMQQQMQQQQGQLNAPIGKTLPIRTQLLTKDGTLGIVSTNAGNFQGIVNRGGNIQTVSGGPQRFQHVRITNPQGLQQQTIIHQGSRMLLQQQQLNSSGQQAAQQGHRMVGIVNTGTQQQSGNQNQPPPPPPPYPGPPPPYPGTVSSNTSQYYPCQTSGFITAGSYQKPQRRPLLLQEQPLLLEDLVEQEKREQERQMISSTTQSQQQQHHQNEISGMQTSNSNLMNEQGFERLKVDVLNNQPQGVPAQGLLPIKQNQIIVNQINPNSTMVGGIRHQFMPRGVNQQHWRGAVPNPQTNTTNISGIQQQNQETGITATATSNFQVYNANLLPPPQLPPENIVTEQDRQIQLVYEQWLNNQNSVLANQLKYYETEVLKLRKVRKSLNSKQRQLKKNGNVLTEPDAAELSKITHEQTFYQKHLDTARKQARQHSLLMQDYKTKQQTKLQQIVSPSQHSNSSPAQIAPPSPMAASPNAAQQHLLLHTSQSPIMQTNSIMQPSQSPLQSPSPMMPSQSPGPQNPNTIMQSPGNPQSNSGMSPYSTMQQSPRIGTPHSQNDEGPFSPTGSAGPSVSPSIPGRLQSPSPRITSPQNRMPGPQSIQGGRIIQTSPIMIQGIQQQQQQQNRFVRPQSLIGDQGIRPRLVQQQQQQGIIRAHPGYNSPLGSPQSNQQVSLEHMQNQRMLLVQQQRRQQQLYQQQQHQQQFLQQQQQQLQQHHQQQQQMTQSSPNHQQPPSPMLQPQQNSATSTSPMPPRSPMIHYNINQPPSSPMIGGSPLMRRPPSTGGPINSPANPDRPQSVESSPRSSFMQHSMNDDQMNADHMNQSGGGGGSHGPIPFVSTEFYNRIKPGLRGGAPIWGRGAKRLPAPTMSSLIKESQQKEFEENEQMKREFHLTKVSILKKKTGPPSVQISKNQNIPSTSGASQKKMDLDEIVVIDSSPDEKQRIMDYDDDNDKALVATEVSLSSVAQHGSEVDDISVIESFQTPEFADIVSSPLESSEVENEYVLFASDVVVDYVDSDDSQKNVIKTIHPTSSDDDKNIHVINLNMSSPEGVNEANNSSDDDLKDKLMKGTTGYLNSPSGDHHYTSREEEILSMDPEIVIIDTPIKSPEGHNIATAEDFEAMIDCGNSKDGKDVMASGITILNDKMETSSKLSPPMITATFTNSQPPTVTPTTTSQGQHILQNHPTSSANSSSVIHQTSKNNEPKIIQIVTQNNTTNFGNVKGSNPIMTYATRIPLSAAMIQTRPGMSQVSLATHKKLVKDTQQTTAKVSIGNTTISVPVLKTVPLQNNNQGMSKMDSQVHKSISLNLSKAPTVINVGSQKSIFTLTTFNLTQPSSNARFVQAINRSSPPVNTSTSNTSAISTSSTNSILYSNNSGQNQITLSKSDNIRDKLSPKPSSSSLSYSKLSSLTVTQDVSLPTKIFEDESISPDSSIEHDENDIIATEKMESLEKELQDKTNQVLKEESKKIENAADAEKKEKEQLALGLAQGNMSSTTPPPSGSLNEKSGKSGVIPVHVIMKSRESSRSPSLPPNQQQRLMSIMPQLSPLSQPNEMVTNMANVPQQLRSIMSSLNASNQGGGGNNNSPTASTNATISPNNTNSENPVNYENILPITKLENVSSKNEEKSNPKDTCASTTTSPSTSTTVTNAQTEIVAASHTMTTSPAATTPSPSPQFVLHPTTNPSKIISAQLLTPTTVSPASTNILVLKQLRTTSSPSLMSQTLTSASQQTKHGFKSGAQSTIIALPQSSSSSSQGEHKFQFITTQLPNLTKIQPDMKDMKMPSSNIILSNALSSGPPSSSTSSPALPPPALIVTSRPGVISSNIPQSTTLTLVTSAQSMTTISGSILGATLSQPSTKSNTNTLLHNQLTNSPFRRSKSTDEVPVFMKEPQPPQVISNKRHSLEASGVKPEPIDSADDNLVSSTSGTPKSDQSGSIGSVSGCKFSNITSNPSTKSEDSQNVLLKQLLQSSGSSTSNTPSPTSPAISTRPVTSLRAPSLGLVSSLEAQLARPVIPLVPPSPLSTISSSGSITVNQNSLLNKMADFSEATTNATTVVTTPITTTHRIVSRETSFVSKPVITPPDPVERVNRPKTPQHNVTTKIEDNSRKSVSTPPVTSYQSVVVTSPQQSIVSTPPISSTPSPVNVLKSNIMPQIVQLQQQHSNSSPPPPYPGKNSTATPVIVKETSQATLQEQQQQQQDSATTQQMNEIKKEIMDETSQQSMLSDQNGSSSNNKPDSVTPKEELNDSMEMDQQQVLVAQSSSISSTPPSNKNAALDPAIEMKRKKRREYQKQRRQMQIMNKELLNNTPKTKKSRKLSKIDEDYDTFIDNLMGQMRQLPSLQILEPLLSKNYNVCPIYGSGDFSKLNLGYNSDGENGSELKGKFGLAEQSNVSDFYNTKPFGFKIAQSDLIPQSTQRGFYDQEFPPIKLEADDEKCRYDLLIKERDIGTPDTIISTSSPECGKWELTQNDVYNFPGLRLIKDENNIDEEAMINRSMSPQIPIIVPVPIRLKTGISLTADKSFNNKENERVCDVIGNSQSKFGPPTPKDNNVTVTLTLTSSAAEDILGVLKDLANILNIPPPSTYQIVERTTTPPSQKLGLYRTKGKDGKEGVPIDIQTILNGAAKFCRHCDVVILNSMIRAKSSEFPLLALNNNANGDIINESEDLYFCSKVCYKQFQWRPTSILDEEKENKILITSNLEFPPGFSVKSPVMMNENMYGIESDRQPNSGSGITLKELLIKQEIRDDAEHQIKRKLENELMDSGQPPSKFHKGSRYKYFTPDCFNTVVSKYKKPTDKELTEMLFRMSITVTPGAKLPEDTRRCIFCHSVGDGVADGPSRLLNFDVDKWVHLNCALWSDGVYETENGALMQLETALQASLSQPCIFCSNLGATLKCFKPRCGNIYHLSCAMKDSVVFYKNKSIMCASHAPKTEKDNELTTLSVERRVYVERDESRQVASVMHYSELSNLMRVGSLIFLNVGQLLPHQLQTFHNQNYIYPNGYKIIRFYWSMRRPNKRCRYICSIVDVSGRPEFRVLVKESAEEDIELRDSSARAVWQRILEPLSKLRKDTSLVQIFPKYVSGEDLFGLSEPAIVRILESLPGIETLTDYKFKYGRNPLLELPLAINPSGAARTEAKLKATLGYHKKPHTQRTGSVSQRPAFVPTTSMVGEVACPYSKQFVHSKSSQYKKMKQEWRNNVFLARSKIQGLGLYAARDLEKHTMVIEYIGEVIRTELSELREKQYEARNRGIYMFRLDEERVVDATLSGGLARYINHSCNPNCVTEIVEVDREVRIIIFAKRRINRGEELSYDYKFDIEDDAHKISCMCGAPNCRKWMN